MKLLALALAASIATAPAAQALTCEITIFPGAVTHGRLIIEDSYSRQIVRELREGDVVERQECLNSPSGHSLDARPLDHFELSRLY